MTNYIPITTPTIKVDRCNKGTNYHKKPELLFSKLKHTHAHNPPPPPTHTHTDVDTCSDTHAHKTCCAHKAATLCNHAVRTANNVVYTKEKEKKKKKKKKKGGSHNEREGGSEKND